MSNKVHCQFKHIPSKRDGEQLAANIETFVKPKVFDKNGIKNCGEGGNDTIQFTLPRDEANNLRSQLAHVLPNDNSPIWFHILSDPLNSLNQFSLKTTDNNHHTGSTFRVSCQFGSLRSYNHFYSHVSFNNKIVDVTFRPARSPDSLNIEFDDIRLIIPFKSIQKNNILVNKENEKLNGIFILLPLKYVPYVYRLEPVKNDNKPNPNPDMKQVRLCGNERNVDFIRDISNCSDLVFHFQPSQDMAWAFLSYFLDDHPERYEINFSNFKISDWSKENNKKQKPDPFDYKNAQFQDRYALQMLISLGFVFRDKWAQLTDQELNWSNWNPDERYTLCCFAAEQLCKDHGYDLTQTQKDYNETRKKEKKAGKDTDQQPISVQNKERLKVAVCTLTPLRIIFQPLEVTTGSRALRNKEFGGPERFLLVHFREEDNRQLRVTNRNIKYRLKNSMLTGIELFNRTFKYMGASTGQMKEMAFWFIDLPPKLKTITDAHNLLGCFNDIKNIATYIARVGQYFSTTWPIGITLTEVKNENEIRPNGGLHYVLRIPDIERNKYCFTDGIGKVSWGLAGLIARKMNIPLSRREDIPSAYQVRVAGCKGMVAIDPNSTLNDYYIHVRKSMMKFESDDWSLEICEFARPMTLTLNNQVIRLLSDLDNHDDVFIALQNRGFTQWEVPEEQQPSAIDIAVQKNFSYAFSKDNLLTNRIPIPPEDGRNMFGIADESGQLKYGECFIQYSVFNSTNNNQREFKVVTGIVIVTKNPCLWPGDFRRLTAVRNPTLEKCMRDVIVFPIDGKRPHSNEISGSDLDGDQYWVYWGDRLKINRDVEPLSYAGAKKMEVSVINHEIIIQHIVESFGAGVILGMIANTHTVVADKHPQHSFSDPCKELAELFALAVDSPKTGQFIEKDRLRNFQKDYCTSWPKYMRKFGEPTSDSTSVLEKLFIRATEKYQQLRVKPMINTFPQRNQGTSEIKINDKEFENWINGGIVEKLPKEIKPSKTKTKKTDDPDQQIDDTPPLKAKEPATNKTPQAKSKNSDDKPSKKTQNQPETPVVQKGKSSLVKEDSVGLINSDPPKSAASSLASSTPSSFGSSNNDPYHPDFLMAADTNISKASVIQFSPVSGNFYIVRTNKDPTENPDRDQIINKLISYMDKMDIFKKKSSSYNEARHGALYLMIFYGHIYFVGQESFPKKLGELQDLLTTKSDQMIHFNYAEIDELDIRGASSSTTKKNKIEYEFDCRLISSPSEYFTLLFDKNKTLRQIRVYLIWSKCYVRLPNFNVDNLYEMRSVITHDLGSPEFDRISNLVFKTQSKELLTDRKPYIKIDRECLHSSVIPISLKVIDEDEQAEVNQFITEAFYRKVKYVSINVEQKDKPKVFSTLEFHVSPISKDKDVFEDVCKSALSPIERVSSDRRCSTSSTASSMPNQVFGFSMFE